MADYPFKILIYDEYSMFNPFSRRNQLLRQKCSEWFLASRHMLMSYAMRQADDMTDVEHLLSVVLCKIMNVFSKGEIAEQAWLPYTYTVIRHEALKWRRKNAQRLATESQYGEGGREAAFRFPVSDELELLRHHIDTLSPLNQSIIRMKIWDELPLAEIARRLNMPESTVRARYQASLNQLRKQLTQHER